MPRAGGIYSLPNPPVVTGTVISSIWANSTLSDIAAALTQSIASDGTTIITANLPLGGFKWTGVGNATARNEFAAAGQVQDGDFTWGGTATRPAIASISSITNVGTTATLNTATAHGLVNGATVVVSGTTPAAYSGTFVISVVDSDTFTYTMLSDPGAFASVVGAYSHDLILVTLSPAITAYDAGQRFEFINAATANTTSSTQVSFNGLTPKTIAKLEATSIGIGDLLANALIDIEYDGTVFRLASIARSTVFQAGISDSQTTTGSSDVTLSAASAGYQSISMTALGKHVKLPDSTTLNKGGPRYFIANDGAYPFGIRDNSGVLLSAIEAGGRAEIYLKDNSTAAGTWGIEGTNISPALITVDSTFSSTFSSTLLNVFVAMDDNTSIHFAALSSGFSAFVVDNTGRVTSTPITVTAVAGDVPCQAFKISATTAIVFIRTGSSNSKAVVLTLTGSSPSFSITVGSVATAGTAAAWAAEDYVNAPRICQLSSTLYSSINSDATNTFVTAISVSGTTVTIGTSVNIITASSVAGSTAVYALTATTFLSLYKSGGAAPRANNAVVVSVSGTTCTVGTPVTLTGCASAQIGAASSTLLSSTKAIVADDNNTTQATAVALTISGTTVTAGTAFDVETGIGSTGLAEYIASQATRYNPHLFALSSSTALFWYLNSTGVSRAVVLTESAGVITKGTTLFSSISNAALNNTNFGTMAAQNTTDFIAISQTGVSTSWRNVAIPHKISGTTVTYGDTRNLPELSPVSVATAMATTRLSQGDYIVMAANSSSLPIMRSNGDVLTKRGDVSIPNLSSPINYPLQKVSSNRIVLIGATQGTTVGSATQQLRMVNVEVAQ